MFYADVSTGPSDAIVVQQSVQVKGKGKGKNGAPVTTLRVHSVSGTVNTVLTEILTCRDNGNSGSSSPCSSGSDGGSVATETIGRLLSTSPPTLGEIISAMGKMPSCGSACALLCTAVPLCGMGEEGGDERGMDKLIAAAEVCLMHARTYPFTLTHMHPHSHSLIHSFTPLFNPSLTHDLHYPSTPLLPVPPPLATYRRCWPIDCRPKEGILPGGNCPPETVRRDRLPAGTSGPL